MSAEKEFESQAKSAFVDQNGMINLGWNKICPTSPFGQQLIKDNDNIRKSIEDLPMDILKSGKEKAK